MSAPGTKSLLTLEQVNAADDATFVMLLDGTYEHSAWIAERAAAARPFSSLAALRQALIQVVTDASTDEQLRLIRAHPELAGKAMIADTLTDESTSEQSAAGLTHCSPEEFERLYELNAAYNDRFGFPFVLAVRGPRGTGLTRADIIDTFARRLGNTPEAEREEALRNIHRIAEIRLNERFAQEPLLGNQVWDQAEALAQHSDPGFAERGELTVTYLTDAHRACAAQLVQWMRDAGFDEVSIDAVGNVVGVYHGKSPDAKRLLTGSHYDTVRNGGKYDGRLGILIPICCVRLLSTAGERLEHGIEVVGFAEEEGQRFHATFLGSGALTGDFNPAWLDQRDADGISMREAMQHAGLNPGDINSLKRNPERYIGFVELHIEQGPVLAMRNQPLGVVTSINGGLRYQCEVTGLASHAGTTPMDARNDALLAAAQTAVFAEQRALEAPDLVATVGMMTVPDGSINVVPGKCRFSLDVRAPVDAVRDAAAKDILDKLNEVCRERNLQVTVEETMSAGAAPCAPQWEQGWADAVSSLGLEPFSMPSGAGHDAMKLHEIMPQGMLFVRGLNNGISHNPLESTTNNDMDLAVQAMLHLVRHMKAQ